MNFLEKFSKTRHTILYKLFSAERQTVRWTDIINWILHYWYAISNVLHIYRIPEIILVFYRHWSRYDITVCQVNTATHTVNWLTKII